MEKEAMTSEVRDASVYNPLYMQNLETQAGRDKIASFGQNYIKDRIREKCIWDKYLPPVQVNPNTDLGIQISQNHDTLYKLEFLETQTQALTGTFRGSSPVQIVRADRVPVAFFSVFSTTIEKTEQELQVYSRANYPLTKLVEELMIKDMEELKDLYAVGQMESAIQGMQKDANGGVATKLNSQTVAAGSVVQKNVVKSSLAVNALDITNKIYNPQKKDFVELKRLVDTQRLPELEFVIMTAYDFDALGLQTLQDFGSQVAGEVIKKGYTYNEFMGLKIITTRKYDIYRPGNVYALCPPDYVGRNYMLNNMKFYVDKVRNVFSWSAWFDWGMSIINAAAVKKLELFGCSVVPGQTDAGFEKFSPFDESELGAKNNRALELGPTPNIVVY